MCPLAQGSSFCENYLMTAEEKTTLARFLDMTGDFLKDGYAGSRETHIFPDGEVLPPSVEAATENTFSSLPLAYQVDEYEPAAEAQTPQEIASAVAACRAYPKASCRRRRTRVFWRRVDCVY